MKSYLWNLLAVIGACLPTALLSQTNTTNLWRDLAFGDSPEQVATKLMQYPQIKSTKVKRSGDVSISYAQKGFEIGADSYKLYLEFDARRLKQVNLATESTCADSAIARHATVKKLLAEKYPTALSTAGDSDREIYGASMSGTEAQPSSIITAMSNGDVVAIHSMNFVREAVPEIGYQRGKLAEAARQFVWETYKTRLAECNGTGDRRAVFGLSYMTMEQFKSEFDIEMSKQRAADNASKDNM